MIQHMILVHNLILHKMEKGKLNLESKEAMKSILQEYEVHTKVIDQQLEICKKDHVELRAEIVRLMGENKDLSRQLQSATENTLNRAEKCFSDNNSDVIDNLNQQLALSLEEKETLKRMWQSGLKELADMEERLHQYQSGKQLTMVQNKLNDAEQNYTEVIKILEARLSAYKAENNQLTVKTELLENQLMQITSQMNIITENNISLKNSLKEATNHEQEWKTRYLTLEAKYIELDRSYQADKVKFAHTYEYEKVESYLKEKLEDALRQRDELQTALERCHERMAELLRNAASDRSRIEEAVALVEGAMQDRDEALAREAMSAEELKKIRSELNNLVDDAGLRVVQETAATKKHFENQLTTLRDQLQISDQNLKRKSVEVDQWQKECKRLQNLLDQSHAQPVPDRRDKQLERVYHELHFTESECLQLRMENEALRDTLRKVQDRYRRHSREKSKLKHELLAAEQQSQLYQHELAVTTERADLLNSQLHETSLELAQLQSEKFLQRDNMPGVQPGVSVVGALELYRKLDDSYCKMNEKWKNEMKALTEKFETKLTKLKKEIKRSAPKDNV